MKSDSKRETTLSPIAAGRPFLSFLASAIFLSVMALPLPSPAGASLPEMARLEASDAVTIDGNRSLFKGYMSLGLLPEAASLLERRVRLGVFPAAAAAPLFDEVVSAQERYDDPERLVAVCRRDGHTWIPRRADSDREKPDRAEVGDEDDTGLREVAADLVVSTRAHRDVTESLVGQLHLR